MQYRIPGGDKEESDIKNVFLKKRNSQRNENTSSFTKTESLSITDESFKNYNSEDEKRMNEWEKILLKDAKNPETSRFSSLSPVEGPNRGKKREKSNVELKATEGYRWLISKIKKETNRSSIQKNFEKNKSLLSEKESEKSHQPDHQTEHYLHSINTRSKEKQETKKEQGREDIIPLNTHSSNKLRKPSLWNILKVNRSPSITNGIVESPKEHLVPLTTSKSSKSNVIEKPKFKYTKSISDTRNTIDTSTENKRLEFFSNSKNLPSFPTDIKKITTNLPSFLESEEKPPNSPKIEKSNSYRKTKREPASPIISTSIQKSKSIRRQEHKRIHTDKSTSSGLYQTMLNMNKLNPDGKLKKKLSDNIQNSSETKKQRRPMVSRSVASLPKIDNETLLNSWNSKNPLTPPKNEPPEEPDSNEINAIETANSMYNYNNKNIIDGESLLVDPSDFCKFLGGRSKLQSRTLYHYMNNFNFTNIRLDEAVRRICSKLLMHAESQEIDRVLYELSRRYIECNPDSSLKTIDIAHTVAFSIFLLNTDLHMADIKNSSRMTRNQYIKNTIDALATDQRGPINYDKYQVPVTPALINQQPKISKNIANKFSNSPDNSVIKNPITNSKSAPPISNEIHFNSQQEFSQLPQSQNKSITNSSKSSNQFQNDLDTPKSKYNFIRGRSYSRTYSQYKDLKSKISEPKIVEAPEFSRILTKKISGSDVVTNTRTNPTNSQSVKVLYHSKSDLNLKNNTTDPSKKISIDIKHLQQSSASPASNFNSSSPKTLLKKRESYIHIHHEILKPNIGMTFINNGINTVADASSSMASSLSNLVISDGVKRNARHSFTYTDISTVLRDIYNGIKEKPLERAPQPKNKQNESQKTLPSTPITELIKSPSLFSRTSISSQPNKISAYASGQTLKPLQENNSKGSNSIFNGTLYKVNISTKSLKQGVSKASNNIDFSEKKSVSSHHLLEKGSVNRDSILPKLSSMKDPMKSSSSKLYLSLQGSMAHSTPDRLFNIEFQPKKEVEPPVAAHLYYRCALLNRKFLFEKAGKKATSRMWRGCYVSLGNGKAIMYKGEDRYAPRAGLVSVLPMGSQPFGTVQLGHTYAQIMPPPGYSFTKPHVFALTLSQGGVYLFQTKTAEEAQQWAFACNYWGALDTKVPYMAGSVYNVEYGWYNNNEFSKDEEKDTYINDSASKSQPFISSSNTQASSKSTKSTDKLESLRDANRYLNIIDWTPPPNPTQSANSNEKLQIESFNKHIEYLESELVIHKTALTSISERFHPRSFVYNKAFHNWEKKAQYLLKELIKYKNYVDCLETTLKNFHEMTESQKVPYSNSPIKQKEFETKFESGLRIHTEGPEILKDNTSTLNSSIELPVLGAEPKSMSGNASNNFKNSKDNGYNFLESNDINNDLKNSMTGKSLNSEPEKVPAKLSSNGNFLNEQNSTTNQKNHQRKYSSNPNFLFFSDFTTHNPLPVNFSEYQKSNSGHISMQKDTEQINQQMEADFDKKPKTSTFPKALKKQPESNISLVNHNFEYITTDIDFSSSILPRKDDDYKETESKNFFINENLTAISRDQSGSSVNNGFGFEQPADKSLLEKLNFDTESSNLHQDSNFLFDRSIIQYPTIPIDKFESFKPKLPSLYEIPSTWDVSKITDSSTKLYEAHTSFGKENSKIKDKNDDNFTFTEFIAEYSRKLSVNQQSPLSGKNILEESLGNQNQNDLASDDFGADSMFASIPSLELNLNPSLIRIGESKSENGSKLTSSYVPEPTPKKGTSPRKNSSSKSKRLTNDNLRNFASLPQFK
ncbi:hypothetical protein BB558_004897 [Smittium angustum]|uniref:SEC7 domain-containing protein n=1 Tax=Smittium angustum TaxID=133377 RepID=A0A2U1J271_SMIAN|nr:hypothetical protein BB558_004897 [Smittium angustum]